MFLLKDRHLVYNLVSLPNLSIIFSNFLHCSSYATWSTPSFNCRHPSMCMHTTHRPYGYPFFMLCSRQWMHWNPWCNLWHFFHHCVRCLFPCGTRTITCVSFNHIQLLLLMSWHCAYQRWHSHFSWHCHYQPKVSWSFFYLGHFSSSKNFDHLIKDVNAFHLQLGHRLSYFLTFTPSRHTSHHHDRSIASSWFLTCKYGQPLTAIIAVMHRIH
jgi:hypothetical protein